MGVIIPVAALDDLRQRVLSIGRRENLEQLARRLGATAIKLLADEFRLGRDPYGQPWAPVYRRRRRDRRSRARRLAAGQAVKADKPLVDTGRLRAAATAASAVQSRGSIVRVVIPVSYARYHQSGTRHITRRQIIPEARTGGLGPIWGRAFNAEAKAFLRQLLKGRR